MLEIEPRAGDAHLYELRPRRIDLGEVSAADLVTAIRSTARGTALGRAGLMATYPAIAATSDAVLGLLQSAAVGTEFDGVAFAHYQSGDFESPMSDGISLYLYRVTVSSNRNLPPQVGPDGRRYRPPIPLDVHYLVTRGRRRVRQQRMLGFAIRTLEDPPILPAGVLNQHGPEPNVFRPEETVELVYESVTQDVGTSGTSRRPRSSRRRRTSRGWSRSNLPSRSRRRARANPRAPFAQAGSP